MNDQQYTPHKNNTLLDAALRYCECGLSVIPTRHNKVPAIKSWIEYKIKIPDRETIESWWKEGEHSIAIICGGVSGFLEVIDFDEKYNVGSTSLFEEWKDLVDLQIPGLVDRLVVQRTMTKGFHAIYRCSTIGGNQKLATRSASQHECEINPQTKIFTLIETRGEGGYFLCFPSIGYEMISGSITDIPEITMSERDVLLSCARALTEVPEQTSLKKTYENKNIMLRPGDDFNKKGDHKQLLESHGWKLIVMKKGKELWRRPGKKEGVSGIFNVESGIFFVFSTNAAPLEADKSYDIFSLYTYLEKNGDFKSAAKALNELGYGEKQPDKKQNGNKNFLIEKIEGFLNKNYRFRRNVVTTRIEIFDPSKNYFIYLDDKTLNSIHRSLLKNRLKIGIGGLHRLLYSDFSEEFDPFCAYFQSLPNWDKERDYIDDLARSVKLNVRSEESLFKEYLQKWLIGLVATALVPKCVNQTAIILVGGQGIGKTRWLNKLVPTSLSEYKFSGTIDPNNKDAMVYLSQCFLIILDELETFRRHEIGVLKSIMTQQDIMVRRPYDRLPQNLIRRASFVGSINKTEFLNDETGSRRFLVFDVKSLDLDSIPDMDYVMAQAYQLFKAGDKWWFSETEISAINDRNMKYSQSSYEEEILLELLPRPGNEDAKVIWCTATEISETIKKYKPDFRIENVTVRNIGSALMKHNYDSKKTNGRKSYKIMECVRVGAGVGENGGGPP